MDVTTAEVGTNSTDWKAVRRHTETLIFLVDSNLGLVCPSLEGLPLWNLQTRSSLRALQVFVP